MRRGNLFPNKPLNQIKESGFVTSSEVRKIKSIR